MKNFFTTYLPLILSVLAIGLSIFAVLRIEPVKLEWLGILVGVLSFITMILIGWQVMSGWELMKKSKEVDGKIKAEINALSASTNALFHQLFIIINYFDKEEYAIHAFVGLVECLDESEKGVRKDIIPGIMSYLKELHRKYKASTYRMWIPEDKRQYCINVLSKYNYMDVEDLVSFTKKLLTKEQYDKSMSEGASNGDNKQSEKNG